MDMLNDRFQHWGIFHEELSIDEAMMKHYGCHSSKKFVRGESIRFGYKNWVLASSDRYCYSFDIYCGAKPCYEDATEQRESKMTLGSWVVLNLLNCVEILTDHFFYNYNSSYNLFMNLKHKGFRATEIVRRNRMRIVLYRWQRK